MVASLLIELILKGSIMKDYFYAIAVEDQILGIDSDFGVYFEEPTVRNISECSVFPDKKGAERFLRYCKQHYKDALLNCAKVKKLVVNISFEEI